MGDVLIISHIYILQFLSAAAKRVMQNILDTVINIYTDFSWFSQRLSLYHLIYKVKPQSTQKTGTANYLCAFLSHLLYIITIFSYLPLKVQVEPSLHLLPLDVAY